MEPKGFFETGVEYSKKTMNYIYLKIIAIWTFILLFIQSLIDPSSQTGTRNNANSRYGGPGRGNQKPDRFYTFCPSKGG